MKSVVLSHGDLDGITSGAIGLLAFPGADFYFTRPSQIHHDLFRIAKDAPDAVSISDIAVNTSRFDRIIQAIARFPEGTKIHWTDHHPISSSMKRKLQQRVEFFHERGPSAAEMMYRKFAERLPEHALHLALYGAIGDFCDDTVFAREHFEDFDKRTLYLESGILVQALQEIDYQRAAKDLVRSLTLGMTPSSMNDIVTLAMKATRIEHEVLRYVRENARKLGQVGYVLDMPIGGYRGKSAKFAAYATDSQIGISARSHDDEIDLSIRLRNSTIDLNKALREITAGIPDAHGGGHPQAAGAGMRKGDFPAFLQTLAEYVEERG
ncbi:DHH family phosphoesterase [Candidatus Thorarchaeota archaeon]|nr:MAG: DHH family phosphoesterase [Candidatus Thorarchaeota archaeon]